METNMPKKRKATSSPTPDKLADNRAAKRRKKPKMSVVERLLAPVPNRKQKGPVDVALQITVFNKRAIQVDKRKKEVSSYDRAMTDSQDELAKAQLGKEAADKHANDLHHRKQTAFEDNGKCDRELEKLEADRQRAEREFANRKEKLLTKKEKTQSNYEELITKTKDADTLALRAQEKVDAAKAKVEEHKDDNLNTVVVAVERTERYFEGMSAKEVFEDLRIPFEFESKKFFTLTSLRAFIHSLNTYGYDKASLLHTKHDSTKLPELWRDSCNIFGIPVRQSEDKVALVKESLTSLWELAHAQHEAQSEEDSDGSDDGSTDHEDSDSDAHV